MYAAWFGLTEPPFAITPDPRYLYLSARHSEALAHLVYALTDSGGFMQLTGEVGTGKTTLVRTLLQRLPEGVDVALVLNPRQSPIEFVRTICEELKVPVGGLDSAKDLMDALNRHLLESHSLDRRTVVIVDEAQALPPDVLEQLRLLTNLETACTSCCRSCWSDSPSCATRWRDTTCASSHNASPHVGTSSRSTGARPVPTSDIASRSPAPAARCSRRARWPRCIARPWACRA